MLNLEEAVNKLKCRPPPSSTIRLSRLGSSFLENMCGHTVMPQIPWSAKYENQNFEKTFPFYSTYKNN